MADDHIGLADGNLPQPQPSSPSPAEVTPAGATDSEVASLFRAFRHLLPRATAWRLTLDSQLRQLITALSNNFSLVKTYADLTFRDLDPAVTTSLSAFEEQFNLATTGLTESQRRVNLAAAWAYTGSLSPHHVQSVLQAAGFDVYVHEWWAPGTENPVNTPGCVAARNPATYLNSTAGGPAAGTNAGEAKMQAGESFAQAGNTKGKIGYPLVNKITVTTPNYLVGAGEAKMQAGEFTAQAGNYDVLNNTPEGYSVPTDTAKHPYFFYVCGPVFPNPATVPLALRDDFENLVIKHRPTHLWAGIIVNYA